MAGVQATGAGWVRFDFDWSMIQPDSATSYSWSSYDQVVKSASDHHLQVMGIIDFTPAWARGADCNDLKQCHPDGTAAYANFAGALAQRYAPQNIHTWEVWNEPNTQNFWKPAPNIAQYSQLLISAASAIHRQDPKALVISGSTAPAETTALNISPPDFIAGLYSNGAGTAFDAVGVHPYTYPLIPSDSTKQAWAQMSQGPASIREVMTKHGDAGKKVWITEFGAPTDGPGPTSTAADPKLAQSPTHVDEALESTMLRQAFGLYHGYSWVGPIFWYSYQDAGSTPDTNENFFGLIRSDGSHKPAYDIFRQSTQTN